MNLSTQYETALSTIKIADLPNFEHNHEALQDHQHWLNGLALLRQSIPHFQEHQEDIVRLYEKLFYDGLDFRFSYALAEEDYHFYWDTLTALLNDLAQLWPDAYAQLAFQYHEARTSFQSKEKIAHYLALASEYGAPIAKSVYAYFLYYNYIPQQDKAEALRLLDADKSEWGRLYRGYLYLETKEYDALATIYTSLRKSQDSKIVKNSYILEACSHEWQGNLEEAKTVFKYCVDTYISSYAMTRYALLTYDDEAPDTALSLLERASTLGSLEAMSNLGHLSFPHQASEAEAYRNSFHWFSVGHLYGNIYATYRLALLHMYVSHYQDMAKGLAYLDIAVDKKLSDALVEKAELYLEGQLVDKDPAISLACFEKAVQAHENPYAYYRLGYMYESGLTASGTPMLDLALSNYEKAAQLNHPYGNSNSGRMYRYGIGTEVDNEKAKTYFERGIDQNNPFSVTELAFMYEEENLEKDLNRAFELFTLASEMNAGYGYAYYIRGQYLEHGYHKDGERNLEQAVQMYEKGAALQDVNSIYEMGRCYRYGIIHEPNPDLAIQYFQQAVDAGLAKGMVELSMCYDYEFGVNFDAQKTFDLMKQAAELNYAYAQYKVGSYLMHGSLGAPILTNSEEALVWLYRARENGQPYALLELGDYYLYDYDQKDEYQKAITYFSEAYEKYEVLSDGLGICYEYGIGTDPNAGEAFKYYEIAANQQNKNAMYRLGRCYLNGTGTKKNESQAYHWFANAANYGDAPSQYHAGLLLLKGQGVAMNKEEGFKMLQQAAEQNNTGAQFELGNCYLMGDGTDEDEQQAIHWFTIAAENGHEQAKRIIGGGKR